MAVYAIRNPRVMSGLVTKLKIPEVISNVSMIKVRRILKIDSNISPINLIFPDKINKLYDEWQNTVKLGSAECNIYVLK